MKKNKNKKLTTHDKDTFKIELTMKDAYLLCSSIQHNLEHVKHIMEQGKLSNEESFAALEMSLEYGKVLSKLMKGVEGGLGTMEVGIEVKKGSKNLKK